LVTWSSSPAALVIAPMTSAIASVVILVPRLEVNRAAGVRAAVSGPLGEPGGQHLAQLRVHGHGPGLHAFADEVQLALAGRQPHVGNVQGPDPGDAGVGVQRQQRERAIPGTRPRLTARR
jgi:hypothetical protein